MKVFITGAAGFIGSHLSRRLVADGHQVLGYDGMTQYYDVRLKQARLRLLEGSNGFTFIEAMLEDKESHSIAPYFHPLSAWANRRTIGKSGSTPGVMSHRRCYRRHHQKAARFGPEA